MTALSAARQTKKQGDQGRQYGYPVAASTTLYKGGLVAINAGGYAVPAADTSGLIVVGVALKTYDNSGGSNGTIDCIVEADTVFQFNASSIAQSSVPELMYVVDDNTFDETDPGNSVKVGKLQKVDSSTLGWIYIPGGGRSKELT